MEKENCFNCENINIHFIIGDNNKKLCPDYPDNLPTTKDIVEVFKCEKYNRIKGSVFDIPTQHPIQPPNIQAVPFSVMRFGSENIVQKCPIQGDIEKIKGIAWHSGFYTGLMAGILILMITLAIIGWLL